MQHHLQSNEDCFPINPALRQTPKHQTQTLHSRHSVNNHYLDRTSKMQYPSITTKNREKNTSVRSSTWATDPATCCCWTTMRDYWSMGRRKEFKIVWTPLWDPYFSMNDSSQKADKKYVILLCSRDGHRLQTSWPTCWWSRFYFLLRSLKTFQTSCDSPHWQTGSNKLWLHKGSPGKG